MTNSPQKVNVKVFSIPRLHDILPGLLLTSGLALLAESLHKLPSLSLLSSLILAIILGIIVKNSIGIPKIYQPGITFSLKRILRLSIILLGLRLSLPQVIEVGPNGLIIVFLTLVSTFIFTCWLGKQLGVNQKLTKLIAAGTSICGASAIVATNGVVESKDEEVAYAVAIVTIFGTLSMLLYPLFSVLFQVTSQEFGIWCGVSIHETAQVIAAAFQGGEMSGELGTITKLSRVIFLVPIVLILGLFSNKKTANNELKKLPIPWFVLVFIALMLLNSLNIFPENLKNSVVTFNHFLLAISMAGMGLKTSLFDIKKTGIKPFYLGAASWLFVSIFSLGLIKIFY
ncbi:YeiH family protein [Crocosphaera sp.]|uniref:YeiH family protein n=1 Tax=Crocosphaera sp. TaxID=2729996 RepID=UPI002606A0FA|nr:YeiH family protein [Crocosphaera sp.]MDJ0582386.1 YeiH family protein [Crocosphaera sp.]